MREKKGGPWVECVADLATHSTYSKGHMDGPETLLRGPSPELLALADEAAMLAGVDPALFRARAVSAFGAAPGDIAGYVETLPVRRFVLATGGTRRVLHIAGPFKDGNVVCDQHLSAAEALLLLIELAAV